jgi:hypothetical protein
MSFHLALALVYHKNYFIVIFLKPYQDPSHQHFDKFSATPAQWAFNLLPNAMRKGTWHPYKAILFLSKLYSFLP